MDNIKNVSGGAFLSNLQNDNDLFGDEQDNIQRVYPVLPLGIENSPDLGSFSENKCNFFNDTDFPEVSDEEYENASDESLVFDVSSDDLNDDCLCMEDTLVEELTVIEKENVTFKKVVVGKRVSVRCAIFCLEGYFSMDESASVRSDYIILKNCSFFGGRQLFAKKIFIKNSYLNGNLNISSLEKVVIANSYLGLGVVLRSDLLIIEGSFTTKGGYVEAKNVIIKRDKQEVLLRSRNWIRVDQEYVAEVLYESDESSDTEEEYLCRVW